MSVPQQKPPVKPKFAIKPKPAATQKPAAVKPKAAAPKPKPIAIRAANPDADYGDWVSHGL